MRRCLCNGGIDSSWRHLRTYTVKGAQIGPFLGRQGFNRSPRVDGAAGVYRCGDYCATPSLNGALRSGRVAAEALLADARAQEP